jgi:membrane-associated phospholipid phosphatase|tara:strand:+ start:81 stop:578 length:498 start_codon:yes stop_codon:yes gene_type:complete
MLRLLLLLIPSLAIAGMQEDTDYIANNLYKVAYVHTALKQDWEGVPQLFLTDAVTNLTVDFLKDEVHSQRPDKSGNDSFPSGHTSDVFAPSFYIYQRYGLVESLPYFVLSTYVGYARVQMDKHNPEDVAASILLSYGMSKLFAGEAPPIGVTWNDGLTFRFFKEF